MDETLRDLERKAAEVAPEVVAWVNALRRAGQFELPPAPPEPPPAPVPPENLTFAEVRERAVRIPFTREARFPSAERFPPCQWPHCSVQVSSRVTAWNDTPEERGIFFSCLDHWRAVDVAVNAARPSDLWGTTLTLESTSSMLGPRV